MGTIKDNSFLGKTFEMNKLMWEVKTVGIDGWLGVECQDKGRAFISMSTDEVKEFVDRYEVLSAAYLAGFEPTKFNEENIYQEALEYLTVKHLID